jgi:hypothetical protein
LEHNLAVLIDFENIAAGTEKEGLGRFDVDVVLGRMKDKGRVLVARSYADWGRFSRFKQGLLSSNVTMMELTSHGMQDKNRADIALVVDALELVFTRDYIDTFVIVSGDSDFTPMVLKMRELNRRVIGCGTRKSTSRLLVNACDEFLFYDTIVSPRRGGSRPAADSPRSKQGEPMKLGRAIELLERTIVGIQRENPDPPLASVVKTAMLRKSPDFSENDLGFSSFARFLESGEKRGKIKVIRDRKSGGYRVETAGGPDETGDSDEGARPRSRQARWTDPYLQEGTEQWAEVLSAASLPVLATPTRLAILQALEEAVADRKKRRRKITIPFVRDDISKTLRRTHPEMPGSVIRSLLDALMRIGQLIHRDGSAIRSPSVAFHLEKGAEELNVALGRDAMGYLRDGAADLSDTALLAHFLLGDPARVKEIEESLAWHAAAMSSADDDNGESSGTEDLDFDFEDLLVVDSPSSDASESAPEEAPSPEPATEEEPTAKAEAAPAEAQAAEAPAAEPVAEVAVDAPAEAEAEAAPAEEKPKRRRVRRRRPKKAAAEEAPAAADAGTDDLDVSNLDALLDG